MKPKIPTYTTDKDDKTQCQEKVKQKIYLGEAIEDYELMARVDGQAEKTLELYKYIFHRLAGYLPQEQEVDSIRTMELRKYFASLIDDGIEKTTIAIHFRELRSFFNWLVKENYLNKAPTDHIRKPRTPKKFPSIFLQRGAKKAPLFYCKILFIRGSLVVEVKINYTGRLIGENYV